MGDKSKRVADSATEHVYKIFPNDLNSNDKVFGGMVMATCDRLALVVAERHSGVSCVTASVDAMHFLAPAGKGDILIFRAAINRAWRSSMEIGIKVLAENYKTRERRHIVSAYFTFVAIDKEGTLPIPQVEVVGEDERRRFDEANVRREYRISRKRDGRDK